MRINHSNSCIKFKVKHGTFSHFSLSYSFSRVHFTISFLPHSRLFVIKKAQTPPQYLRIHLRNEIKQKNTIYLRRLANVCLCSIHTALIIFCTFVDLKSKHRRRKILAFSENPTNRMG